MLNQEQIQIAPQETEVITYQSPDILNHIPVTTETNLQSNSDSNNIPVQISNHDSKKTLSSPTNNNCERVDSLQNTQSLTKEDQLEKKPWYKRVFKPLTPGSLCTSIFNLCILSLGTGSLALPQKFYYMTIIFSPIIIGLMGMANYWALAVLGLMANKYNTTSYSTLCLKVHGKWLSKLLCISSLIFIIGLIIVYQVILYKLIGGLINEIGKYGFESLDVFLTDSFWKKYDYKFPVSYGIALILIPICLLKNISKMRFASVLGIVSYFLLILIIIIQAPWYIIDFVNNEYKEDDPKFQYNYWDLSVGFDEKLNFFKMITTLLYAYSCQYGALPVMASLQNHTEERTNKLFRYSIILDAICYFIIGMAGYLSVPIGTPDLIFERKSIFENDWVMAIGRIAFILTLLVKIPANYNSFRLTVIEVFELDPNFSNCFNVALTVPILLITTLISVMYQSITDYISLLGSFCSIIISFLVPGLVYVKGNDYKITHWKNISSIILTVLFSAMGLLSGVLTIIGIVEKVNNSK